MGRGDVVVPTAPGQLTSGFVVTTIDSTTFTAAYLVRARRYYRDCLIVRYTLATPGAGAAQVRLRLPNQNVNSDTLSISSGSTVSILWQWEHGQDISEVGGTDMMLELQVRRSSGSGNITLFNPGAVTFAPSTVIADSAPGGNPVIE